MPVWPGDTPTNVQFVARMETGSSVNVGSLSASLHAGTHADAPLHYRSDSAAIDQLPLDAFLGRAYLWESIQTSPITREQLLPLEAIGIERLLVRTMQSTSQDWVDDFAYPEPDAIDFLADIGVRLIGLDSPSFDAVDSTTLPGHNRLAERGVCNLENLDLVGLEAGRFYTLLAAPLKIVGMDAAPVRALLIDDQNFI
ncbi:cyclase family protein [soil metagenome]